MWALIVGHLIADFIFQTDWEARNKTIISNKKWYGFQSILIVLFHSSVVLGCMYGVWYLEKGAHWQTWQILAVLFTHAIQDWTRFPFLLMSLRGQFEGIKCTNKYVSINDDNYNANIPFKNLSLVKKIREDDDFMLHEKQAMPDAYIWAQFVVDQVWHYATYFAIFFILPKYLVGA